MTTLKNFQDNAATLQIAETLLVTLATGEQASFSLDVPGVQQAKTWLQEFPLTGGIVKSTTPFILTFPEGSFELSYWLSEALNCPFIWQTPTDTDQDLDCKLANLTWRVDYYGYTPGKDEYAAESLLTVGNGYLGLRGTAPEMEISDDTYPATYLASLYNTAYSQVADRQIANEDFVNGPNLQKIYLVIDDQRLDFTPETVSNFHRSLDFRSGLLTLNYTLTTTDGRQIALQVKKIASMAQREFYSLSYRFKPLNFTGEITVVTEADGTVYNYNVARYRSLENRHLTVVNTAVNQEYAQLVATTKNSKITIVQTSQLAGTALNEGPLITETTKEKVFQSITLSATKNQWYHLEKTVWVGQFRQEEEIPPAVLNLPLAASQAFLDFESLAAESKKAWEKLWETSGITISGDFMSQKLLNLHTYHLLASASPAGNKDLDASVTARGLHGEAYRGHIFWDELFILPFYILRFPETARQLLMYRYQRLAAAKADAKKIGLKGAMFPWQSGLDGSEQSQELHLNPISGEWKEDHSRRQRHVSLAIAYNVWQYWHNTGDLAFMENYGLELLLEIAHFWESISQFDEDSARYSIHGVMGPDEFHEAYPDAKEGGLTDNAYTNMMVVWLFEEIAQLQKELPEASFRPAQDKTGLVAADFARMEDIRHKLALEINKEGIIAQFKGYFDLADLDWEAYRQEYGNIYRLDRILNAEGKSADHYKVAKQADSLMIYYNFSTGQVNDILKDLGYRQQLPETYVADNLHYYLARTSHGSTLSRVVHAQLAAMVAEDQLAWQLYQEALYSDYRDIQGGTTAEGIHAGVMAATLYIPLTTFAGMDVREEVLTFAPRMPQAWEDIAYHITVKNINYSVKVTHKEIFLTASQDTRVMIGEKLLDLKAGQELTYHY